MVFVDIKFTIPSQYQLLILKRNFHRVVNKNYSTTIRVTLYIPGTQQRGSVSNRDDRDLQRVRDRLEEHARGQQQQSSQMKRNDADGTDATRAAIPS